MKEETQVRQNMMDDKSYRPYCGNMGRCGMPRVDKNFKCPNCGSYCKFDPEFFERYKKKWNL